MKKQALVLKNYREDACGILEDAGFEVIRREAALGDEEALVREMNALPNLQLMVVGMENITERSLAVGRNLRVIGRTGVGCDQIDQKTADRLGICVCNSPATSTRGVAEHVIYLLLSLVHQSTRNYLLIGRGGIPEPAGEELAGKTLGIIGCGRIGRMVASFAQHLGMKTVGYDPMIPSGENVEGIAMMTEEEVLKISDAVTLHMPALPETRGTYGMKRFRLMKKDAYFINCARGALVVEEELVQALKEGVIKGAGLDVYGQEPVSPDNELMTLENVVLTPHSADYTTRVMKTGHANASRIFVELFSTGDSRFIINHPDPARRAERWKNTAEV